MAALISRFVNVPIARAHPAECPTQLQSGSHASWLDYGWLGDCILLPPHPAFFNTCHPFAENLPLTTSASCIPLSYSPPIVHSVTVCFTLDHPLSHSHSLTSIKCLSPIAVSFPLAAFPSLVNSLFSQLSPLSAHSLYLSCVPSLHLN